MNEHDEIMWDLICQQQETKLHQDYCRRHGIYSATHLTINNDEIACGIAAYLETRINGQTVVEIGGGIGLMAFHLADYAARVYCIEADPMWASAFTKTLYEKKPRNVSYLFGTADEFVGVIKGDVAVICTHSDVEGMKLIARQFAPVVIDVWGELMAKHPQAFDAETIALRGLSGYREGMPDAVLRKMQHEQ